MSVSYDLNRLLKWRCIGPFRGGRVVTVAGDPVNPATFYFGACAGGVWKTSDGGKTCSTSWRRVCGKGSAKTTSCTGNEGTRTSQTAAAASKAAPATRISRSASAFSRCGLFHIHRFSR